MSYRIPLSYNPINAACLAQILERYEGQHHDRLITDFEKSLADITKSPHVVALNSGTAAIHLGLKALGVKRDDEVLVSTFTYVGSINPITYLGARPVFIDSEMQTWNMDPQLLEVAITDRLNAGIKPKAILVVHAYGMPANMTAILAISKKYEIPVLEDAAEALGSTYHGQHLGTLGDVGIISFNNNKILTTYGGGAILTQNAEIAQRIQFWSRQSRENKPFYEHHQEGYSYRMGPLNAACGLTGLPDLENKIKAKRAIYALYHEKLKVSGIQFLNERVGYYSNRWLGTVILNVISDQYKEKSKILAAQGIETRPLWNPMHKQPAYITEKAFLTGNAENLFKSGLALPSGDKLSESAINEVVEVLKK